MRLAAITRQILSHTLLAVSTLAQRTLSRSWLSTRAHLQAPTFSWSSLSCSRLPVLTNVPFLADPADVPAEPDVEEAGAAGGRGTGSRTLGRARSSQELHGKGCHLSAGHEWEHNIWCWGREMIMGHS